MPQQGFFDLVLFSDIIDASTSTSTNDVGTIETTSPVAFYPLFVTVSMVEETGVVLPAQISIGLNSSSYNDIAANQAVGTVAGKLKLLDLSGEIPYLEGGPHTIKCKVNAAATGLGSQVCKFRVAVYGWYLL